METQEKYERLQIINEAINKAITETIEEFLRCPEQFHGDTGISHYLYHCIHKHAGKSLYSSSKSTVPNILLLQSEYYTKQQYRYTGTYDSGGKFDFAFVDEETIEFGVSVSQSAKALIGIEVGLNKDIDKALGTITAGINEQAVRPADITKIVREIKSGNLRYGYILEFYSVGEERKAIQLLQELQQYAETEEIKGWMVFVVRAKDFQGKFQVDEFPSSMIKAPIVTDKHEVKPTVPPRPRKQTPMQEYLQACSPCNKKLQEELAKLMERHPLGRKPNYGCNNMSLARHYRIKVSNLNEKPEKIYDIDEKIQNALGRKGFSTRGAILIPHKQENCDDWVMRIVETIEEVMDNLAIQ